MAIAGLKIARSIGQVGQSAGGIFLNIFFAILAKMQIKKWIQRSRIICSPRFCSLVLYILDLSTPYKQFVSRLHRIYRSAKSGIHNCLLSLSTKLWILHPASRNKTLILIYCPFQINPFPHGGILSPTPLHRATIDRAKRRL